MNIAIIGAGFAGLATCYHLLNSGKEKCSSVTLFDKKGIGAGASGIAAGLLHPYSGPRSKPSWQHLIAMQEALNLLRVASSKQEVACFKGILRPCTTEEHFDAFSLCEYEDTEQWDAAKVEKEMPLLLELPALYIRSGIAVHTRRYLQELWNVCSNMCAFLEIRDVKSMKELSSFDHVIATCGAYVKDIEETKTLRISQLKGQILRLKWPDDLPPLSIPLNSEGYLVMSDDGASCYAGATFERGFADLLPDREKAENEIRKKIAAFAPHYSKLPFLECQAGVRAYSKTRLPSITRLSKSEWCLTGLGSKGLLYHAWAGKMLSQAIIENSTSGIPQEVLSSAI